MRQMARIIEIIDFFGDMIHKGFSKKNVGDSVYAALFISSEILRVS